MAIAFAEVVGGTYLALNRPDAALATLRPAMNFCWNLIANGQSLDQPMRALTLTNSLGMAFMALNHCEDALAIFRWVKNFCQALIADG